MKHFSRILYLVFVGVLLTAPVVLLAEEPGEVIPPPPIENPLGELNSLDDFILKVVDGAAQIGYYLVIFFIIYSGFKFVKARGNKTELEDAKKTFMYTVIGAAILLGATLLASVIRGTVDQLRGDAHDTKPTTSILV